MEFQENAIGNRLWKTKRTLQIRRGIMRRSGQATNHAEQGFVPSARLSTVRLSGIPSRPHRRFFRRDLHEERRARLVGGLLHNRRPNNEPTRG